MNNLNVKHRKDYQALSFCVTQIDLDMHLNADRTLVKSSLSISKNPNLSPDFIPNFNNIFFHGNNLELVAVKLNQQDFSAYTVNNEGITLDLSATNIALEITQNPDFSFTVEFENYISPIKNTALNGLYASGKILCSQCEAEGFRNITYMFDRPDNLAIFTNKLTANKKDYPYLLSNGNKIASGDNADGTHFVKWHDPFPKPTYLFAVVAGDFDLLQDNFITKSGRNVALEIFVDKGNLHLSHFAMESLKKSMAWDEKRFNLEYDLDIFMIVAVDFFNMGAMENKGLNVFNSKFVLADDKTATDDDYLDVERVIAHEYFHNWTGDRITCQSWFELSLKEGLTVFRDQEFSSDTRSRRVNRIDNIKFLRTHQFSEDKSPNSHPIRPEKVMEMNNFYTVTVYEKGAEVIRMMHTILGEEKFQQGMQYYIKNFDGKAARCEDFVASMEATGVDLNQFRRWYSQSGTPMVSVTPTIKANSLVLNFNQETKPTLDQPEKLPLYIPCVMSLLDADGQALDLSDFAKNNEFNYDSETRTVSLILTKENQDFVFENVVYENSPKPTAVLFQQLSAPVNFSYPYSEDDLIKLATSKIDTFVRYDSINRLYLSTIEENIQQLKQHKEMRLSTKLGDALDKILTDEQNDYEICSLLLELPTATDFYAFSENLNPHLISKSLEFLHAQIASRLILKLAFLYQSISTDGYKINNLDIAKRRLRNLIMDYLSTDNAASHLVENHYWQANNMTDSLAAITVATNYNLDCKDKIMADFGNKWNDNSLVLDKWFRLSASDDAMTPEKLEKLMQHPKFDFNNPNRLRAVVGGFCSQSLAFHNIDGSGYEFLYEILVKLNQSNPQIASRLIEFFMQYKNFDKPYRNLMRDRLERLSKLELSIDLREKVDKALMD